MGIGRGCWTGQWNEQLVFTVGTIDAYYQSRRHRSSFRALAQWAIIPGAIIPIVDPFPSIGSEHSGQGLMVPHCRPKGHAV